MSQTHVPSSLDIRDKLQVVLRPPPRSTAQYILPRFMSLDITLGKFLTGDATLSFIYHGDSILSGILDTNGYGWGLDVWYNNTSAPLFTGVVRNFDAQRAVNGGVQLTMGFEHIGYHILRRRLNSSSANATVDVLTTPIDNIPLQLMRWGLATLTPTGYSGSNRFTSWGSGQVNAVAVAGLHSPGSGTNGFFSEESGNNLADAVFDRCEKDGTRVTISEPNPTAQPGYWALDTVATYTRYDLRPRVLFSDINGTLLSVRKTVDYSAMANTVQIAGQGKNAAQTYYWVTDSTAEATYGIYEDRGNIAGVTNTSALVDAGNAILGADAYPITTWELRIRDREGAAFQFNNPFGIADMVRFETWSLGPGRDTGDPIEPGRGEVVGKPITVDANIVGAKLSFQGGYVEPDITLTLGKPHRNLFWEVAKKVGTKGGRRAGSAFFPNHGG